MRIALLRAVRLGWAVLAMAAAAGCGSADSQSKPDAVIGVSVLTKSNPFFNELADAIVEEAAKHNYRVVVADGNNQQVTQDQQVDDFITKQVDAIVLCPCDSKAVGATIVKANQVGIPVFTADIASLSDQGKVVCHVATDNFAGGKAAADAVIEVLGGKGKVAILDFPEVESVILRTKGFFEKIKEAPGIQVVTTLPGGGDEAKSADAAKDILQSHQDLDAFFCINDPSAKGAINAIEELGKTGRVKVVGFDAQLFARQFVRDGQLYATIVQYPKEIGATVADRIHRHLVGKDVEPERLIKVNIYRKADADKDPLLATKK
jgi:ribose transport system substrate-binding protein